MNSENMTVDNLASSIRSISVPLPLSSLGDAMPEDVAEGKVFTSAAGLKAVGTMEVAEGDDPYAPLDPVEVYNATRPKDWYPMPAPNENELYLLMNVPKDGSALLAFTVICTGSYTVTTYECTTLTNLTEIETQTVASNTKYETTFLGSDLENGYLTSDGMRQVLVRISGESITKWVSLTHSKKTSPSNYVSWNIVEVKVKLPNVESFSCKDLRALRYFSLVGENSISDTSNMFNSCPSLTSIPALDTSNVTNMTSMFSSCPSLTSIPALDTSNVNNMTSMFGSCSSLTSIPALDTSNVNNMTSMFGSCYSLISIPALDTSNVTSMGSMFSSCYSLTSIPALDTSNVTSMNSIFNNCHSLTSIPVLDTSNVTNTSYMFRGCYSLTSIPALDTSNVTSMNYMFNSCYSLTSIPALDTSKVTDMRYMFSSCDSLSHITLNPSVTNWAGLAIDLKQCSLLHNAIIDLFNSLPTITTSQTLTLTGNPGVSDLTDEEKLIATNKGWTLTL